MPFCSPGLFPFTYYLESNKHSLALQFKTFLGQFKWSILMIYPVLTTLSRKGLIWGLFVFIFKNWGSEN